MRQIKVLFKEHYHVMRGGLRYGNLTAKEGFETEKEALKVGKRKLKYCRAYQCRYCNKWHLTTQQPKFPKAQ